MFAVYDGHGGTTLSHPTQVTSLVKNNVNSVPTVEDISAIILIFTIVVFSLLGEEVALYCSKYLPDVIKEQKTYKDGKLQKVSWCLINAVGIEFEY